MKRGENVPFWFLVGDSYEGYGHNDGRAGGPVSSFSSSSTMAAHSFSGQRGVAATPRNVAAVDGRAAHGPPRASQIMVHASKPRMIAKSMVAETSRKRLHDTQPPHKRNPGAIAEIEYQQVKLMDARKVEIRNQHRQHSQHVKMYNDTLRHFRDKRAKEVKAMAKAAASMKAAPPPAVGALRTGRTGGPGERVARPEDGARRSVPFASNEPMLLEYQQLEQASTGSAFPLQSHPADMFGGGFRRRQRPPPRQKSTAADGVGQSEGGRGGREVSEADGPTTEVDEVAAANGSTPPFSEGRAQGDWFGQARIPPPAAQGDGLRLGKLLPLSAAAPVLSSAGSGGSWRIVPE
mmetsp:Transcript_1874/g.3819  ORF Transcript_1874/g.3819 Transcript_1874/m.3819 type:complete len:349 (-) Transcript_1874:165-1211(-)